MEKPVLNWLKESRISTVLLLFVIGRLISAVGVTLDLKLWPNVFCPECASLKTLNFDGNIDFRNDYTQNAARDFGNCHRFPPAAVLYPLSTKDISILIKSVYKSSAYSKLTIAAKGHAHSLHGQAQSLSGVIISMESLKGIHVHTDSGFPYVDVSGGELWIDVLHETLKQGLAPRSWTDYLYLSVGGTLSNAGISGQAFRHGPQISNVYHLQIVTGKKETPPYDTSCLWLIPQYCCGFEIAGKGEILNCSREKNTDLFYGALGGLGQFGIITMARIALEQAPQMVRWIRVLYSDFAVFTRDQEFLISEQNVRTFDYIEGFVIVNNEGLINNWRSSFFSPKNPVKVSSLNTTGLVLYCLEMTKNYNYNDAVGALDEEVNSLLSFLNFIPSSVFTTDLPYADFLDRVHTAELKLRSKGLWDVPHPWLNLFVPKSKIAEFDARVFKDILRNNSNGPILIFPLNRNKWDNRMSAVTPDEDIFYLVALLRSAIPSSTELISHGLDSLTDENNRILSFCNKAAIGAKQYLPHYTTQKDWKSHFGEKWDRFVQRKANYDPNAILAPGQRIFSRSNMYRTIKPTKGILSIS
eukprot:Gb_39064 [translate_table: standard]